MSPETQPDLPSLVVAALLVPLPMSSWLVHHSAVEVSAQPTWMDNATDDHRPYFTSPNHDTLSDPVVLPSEEPDSTHSEFSFRAAWEITRSVEHLPPAWRHVYRKWNRTLSEEHDLSMSSGGAHRYTRLHDTIVRTPPTPPTPATIELGMSRSHSRRRQFRSALYRRLGIVRCPRTNQFARDPDSSWTSHGPLDRRVRWARPA